MSRKTVDIEPGWQSLARATEAALATIARTTRARNGRLVRLPNPRQPRPMLSHDAIAIASRELALIQQAANRLADEIGPAAAVGLLERLAGRLSKQSPAGLSGEGGSQEGGGLPPDFSNQRDGHDD